MSQEETGNHAVRAIDADSVHRITSGQVVSDLQTAVKELVENSLDAKATNIEVRFKDYGLKSIEVIDNGTGIAPDDYDSVGLKHHTSKLATFEDLTSVISFGFRGEALSSLCALSESVSITTSTSSQAPMGTVLELDRNGHVRSRNGKVARQRGTTVTINGLFVPLPVRRKELQRNAKREFAKALNLLNAYALVPCTKENQGVRLTVSNQPEGGRKSFQLRTDGSTSLRTAVSALWGPKSLENIVDLDLEFEVETERSVLRRRGLDRDSASSSTNTIRIHGLVSKFSVGCGRTGTDRQFFFINGRPCSPAKVQKAFNEVYKTFNIQQSPFIVADFIIPTESCDINVSPDKRTILLHSENNLIEALKAALTDTFSSARSTFALNATQASQKPQPSASLSRKDSQKSDSGAVERDEQEAPDEDTEDADVDELDQSSVAGPSRPGSQQILKEHTAHGDDNTVPPSVHDDEPLQPDSSSPPEPLVETHRMPAPRLTDPVSHDAIVVDAADEDAAPSEDEDEEPLGAFKDAGANDSRKSISSADITWSVSSADASRRTTSAPSAPYRAAQKQTAAADAQSSSRGSSRASSTGRAPATVERILSGDADKSESAASGEKKRGVQMTLDTSGASWNLRRGASVQAESDHRRKRPRLETGSKAKESFMTKLKSFASGSQAVGGKGETALQDEPEEEQDEREEEDEEMGDVGSEREEAAQPDLSTAIVDETMDVDVEESLVEDHPITVDEGRPALSKVASGEIIDLTDDEPRTSGQNTPAFEAHPKASSSVVAETADAYDELIRPPEVIRTISEDTSCTSFDLSRVVAAWGLLCDKLDSARASQEAGLSSSQASAKEALWSKAGIGETGEAADEVLSRVLHKDDFETMEVVGQFNLGFIIARRRKAAPGDGHVDAMDDLFIVDQHASDEKYNFETLQQTTQIESQRLYTPRTLELTAADQLVAIENIDVLKQNGFEIAVDESADPDEDRRVKLVAQPVSKATVFDVKDLEELLHLMHDRPAGTMVRCSKARAMFAMRACRKSIMVGKALPVKQMTTVIRHMGTIEQPWNCPHGRPTMRHLSDITSVGRGRERKVDWENFTGI